MSETRQNVATVRAGAWWAAVLATAVIGAAAGARAQSDEPLSIEELARRADVVVVGEVTSVTGEWNATRNQIVTRVDVRVDEAWKGSPEGGRLQLEQPGGRVGDTSSEVAGAPTFRPGERVLLFLARRSDDGGRVPDALTVVGLFQGKFTLERDETGGEVAVRRVPGSGEVLDRVPIEGARAAARAAR